MSTPKTTEMTASSAQICRDLGWEAGTALEEVGNPSVRIALTAIGRIYVLGEQLEPLGKDAYCGDGFESIIDLRLRNWQRA